MKSNAVHLHHVRHPLLPSQCDRVGVPWPGNKSRSPKINRGPDIAWGFNAHICCTLNRILYATSEYLVAPWLGSLSYTLLRNFCRKVGKGGGDTSNPTKKLTKICFPQIDLGVNPNSARTSHFW